MCGFMTPKVEEPEPPVIPTEPAQAREPDAGKVGQNVRRKVKSNVRGFTSTILTGGGGAGGGMTAGKTLLGQ